MTVTCSRCLGRREISTMDALQAALQVKTLDQLAELEERVSRCVCVCVCVCVCGGGCFWGEGAGGNLLSTPYRDFEHQSRIEDSLKKVEDLKARGEATRCCRVAVLMQYLHNSPGINEAQDRAPTSAEAHADRLPGS